MADFNVNSQNFGSFAVIRSTGYINNLGGEIIAKECRSLIRDGIHGLILNLRESTIVNSIGISILIEIIEDILQEKGRLAFSDLTPTVAKTFKIMGLLQFADLYETEQDAINAFNGTETPDCS
ncbi:STAS domain-containing protein [bacterium]|nr:STAS domain-containing protein [candidate division CSSED10-310 bacterium]